MTGLRTIEATLFDHRDTVVVGKRIHRGRAHTAAGGGAGQQQTVNTMLHQKTQQWRTKKSARLVFADDNVTRMGHDFFDDRIAVESALNSPRLLIHTRIFPRP